MDDYRGYNGTITIDGDVMIITHHGFAAKASGLVTGQPRRIPLAALSGVRLRPATLLTKGALAIGTGGASAPQDISADCLDAVMFLRKHAALFQGLHEWLVTVVETNRSNGIDPALVEVDPAPQTRLQRLQRRQQGMVAAAVSTGPLPTPTRALVPFPLWGQSPYPNVEVSGEYYHSREIKAVVGQQVPEEGTEGTYEAMLVPEPTNRHDRNAVQVLIGGHLVGYLSREDAPRYQGRLVALRESGLAPTVGARVWARPEVDYTTNGREVRTGHLHARVTLQLGAPHLITPLNASPGGVELPLGRSVKVSAGPSGSEACAPWLQPEGEGWVHATLHRVQQVLARSTREIVEVRIDGIAAGTLSPTMSQNYLPLLAQLDDRDTSCVVRAMVKGNRVKSEVTIHGTKAAELTELWLEKCVYSIPTHTQPVAEAEAPAITGTARNMAEDGKPAGWYEDPEGIAKFRYWDGVTWTSRIKMT